MKSVTTSHSQDRQSPLGRDEILFSFAGRIQRRTFWLASLAMLGISILLYATLVVLLVIDLLPLPLAYIGVWFVYVFYLFSQYAISAKRWHDRNKSGWWNLVSLIPLVNLLMIIELGFRKGTDGPNRFGPPA